MRLLVIEHDTALQETIRKLFTAESFSVDVTTEGEEGLRLSGKTEYDLIVLGNAPPKLNGLALCRELRRGANQTPVLLLSPAPLVEDKAALLDAGIDDYLTTPCNLEELRFRVRSLIRRPRVWTPALLKVDDLVLDPLEQRVRRGAQEIYLTRREFALAEYLIRRAGAVVGRPELLARVWGNGLGPWSNTVEAHIMNLRRKIDSGRKRKLIHTIPGRGYKIAAPDRDIFV